MKPERRSNGWLPGEALKKARIPSCFINHVSMSSNQADFTKVTDVPGVRVTRSELSQMYTRYHWAAGFVSAKRVLELGCGSGYFLKRG